MNIDWDQEQHGYLGYVANGIYACQCGAEFRATTSLSLLADQAPAILALKDQWRAHLREVQG